MDKFVYLGDLRYVILSILQFINVCTFPEYIQHYIGVLLSGRFFPL